MDFKYKCFQIKILHLEPEHRLGPHHRILQMLMFEHFSEIEIEDVKPLTGHSHYVDVCAWNPRVIYIWSARMFHSTTWLLQPAPVHNRMLGGGGFHNPTDISAFVGSNARCRTTKIGWILFLCVVSCDIPPSVRLSKQTLNLAFSKTCWWRRPLTGWPSSGWSAMTDPCREIHFRFRDPNPFPAFTGPTTELCWLWVWPNIKKKIFLSFPPPISWDRCYDFLNFFAEKFSKKWRFLLKTKLNFEKSWS
jgi:hypothetical protein